MEFTLSLVALNLGTVIVIVLAAVFFGGILFLASHSRTQPAEPPEVVAGSKVTPINNSLRPVKQGEATNQTRATAPLKYDKGRKKSKASSRA